MPGRKFRPLPGIDYTDEIDIFLNDPYLRPLLEPSVRRFRQEMIAKWGDSWADITYELVEEAIMTDFLQYGPGRDAVASFDDEGAGQHASLYVTDTAHAYLVDMWRHCRAVIEAQDDSDDSDDSDDREE